LGLVGLEVGISDATGQQDLALLVKAEGFQTVRFLVLVFLLQTMAVHLLTHTHRAVRAWILRLSILALLTATLELGMLRKSGVRAGD
jgi:hypothetical protein